MYTKKKLKKDDPFTFENHLVDICQEAGKTGEKEIGKVMTNIKQLSDSMSFIAPLFYVIDYTQSAYRLMTDHVQDIVGEPPEAFIEGGLAKLIDIYQKDDFRMYNEKIFKNNRDFFKTIPNDQHSQYIFSYNFRVKHKKGFDISVYQKGFYITSPETGTPLFSIGMVQDISLFKKDTVMCHSIEKNNETGSNIVQQHFYFPNEENRLITPQEKRVLQYIAQGKSTKEIACLLYISENTAITHRKNILKKTNTLNTAELLTFAYKTGLL